MPLPAGFELETAPSRLPAGFELEQSGIKLPPGFELENSPVQKMDKTAPEDFSVPSATEKPLTQLPWYKGLGEAVEQAATPFMDAIKHALFNATQFNDKGKLPTIFKIGPGRDTLQEESAYNPPQPGVPMVSMPRTTLEAANGLPPLYQMAEGLTTPGNVASAGIAARFAAARPAIGALFGVQGAGGLQDTAQTLLDPNASPEDKRASVEGIPMNVAMLLGAHEGLVEPVANPHNLGAEAFRSSQPRPSDFSDLAGQVPPERQLPAPAPVTRFSVAPQGQVVDLSQLTPKEQTELLRGPREYIPRERYVQPAKEEAPVIKAATTSQVLGLPEGFELEDKSPTIEVPFGSDVRQLKQPDDNWQVSVQEPQKLSADKTVPGYVQVDDLSEGQNKWSKGPEALQKEGYDIPDLSQLPQGRYTMAEAKAKLAEQNAVPEPVVDKSTTLKSAADKTLQPGHSLHGGVPIEGLEGRFKRIKRFLSGMNDAGHKTVYSEHGLEDQTSTPYVVFSEPSKEQIVKIQAAADHVGASVDIRPKRTGVYFKGGIQKDVMQDWADFTHKLTTEDRHAGAPIEDAGEKAKSLALNLKEREKELRSDYALAGPRIATTPEQIGFKDVTKQVDAQQLYNRLRNKLSPDEWEFYKDKLPTEGKISPESAAKLMQENGPRIEVKKFGAREQTSQQREFAQLVHETDSLPRMQYEAIHKYKDGQVGIEALKDWASPEWIQKAERLKELHKDPQTWSEASNSHWSSISPKAEKDMPEYTEIAVTKPYKGEERIFGRQRNENIGAQFPSTHSYPPNTLAQVRGYMDKVGDKKVFHIIEVQSDWAQKVREGKKRAEQLYPEVSTEVDQQRLLGKHFLPDSDTLLPHYERLAIKAAIEHAKKEGADAIVIQDAESAMMTEGHDRAARDNQVDEGEPGSRELVIPQEKGMRLHYDQILPKIAKELTGHEGEPVSLGDHKMAYENKGAWGGEARDTVNLGLRENLIFKNKEGTPKTDVSGRMYSIEKAGGPGPKDAPHSVFEKDKPDSRPQYLYSGVPLMNLEGVKEAFKKLGSLNNPTKVVEGAKEMVPRVLDAVYGQGVERGFDESVAHLKSKRAGESAPHHTAVSAELGNKMIEYASANATVDAYIKAGAPKAADYKSNALKAWLNQGIKDGVYAYDKPKANLTMGGRPMEPVSIRVKGAKGGKDSTLYVRADLAPEVKQVLSGQGMIPKAGAQIVLDALTRVQLFGPMDFVAHTANMYSTIVHSQGKFGNYAADLAARMPVAKQIDAIQKVGWQIYKVLRDDPATLKRLAELSEIGTGRTDIPMSSLTGKMIRNFDKGGRLVRDQMYDNLVKMKLTKDTVEGRREFINKMGQYNQKLMSYFMATAKNYVSPFVVAGRRFVKNATQAITLQNEVKAASPTAYAQMKFSNALSLTATAIAAPVVLNSILTGKPFGRAGTPVGKIDTGKDSADGRPITIDLMKLDLTRRGLQATGMESAIEGIRKGSKPGDIASKMIWDMLQAQLHPWEGPAIRGGLAAEKEYAVSRDPKEALIKGGAQMNPVFGSFEKDEQGKTKGLSDYVMRVGTAVGVGKGNFLTHQEKLEQQTGKLLDKMSLEDRLKAERQLKDSQPKLSAEVRTKAAQRQVQKEYKDSQELQDSMPKATKGWLESRELSIPGYKDSIHIAGTDITLTDTEKARYKELVQAEYTKAIDMMKNDKAMNGVGFDNLPKDGKQIAFNKIMIAAKKIARGKLTAEIESVGRSSQK